MKLAGGNGRTHRVDLLFALALFCVFAASALLVVLIGARVYRGAVDRMNAGSDRRASVTYVTNKIRQNDRLGAIHIVQLSGGTTGLALDQELDGVVYQTILYHYDGALREVFVEKDSAFHLSAGQSIVELRRFTIDQTADGLYWMEAEDRQGNTVRAAVASRCG